MQPQGYRKGLQRTDKYCQLEGGFAAQAMKERRLFPTVYLGGARPQKEGIGSSEP
jgi:hypothetical protein